MSTTTPAPRYATKATKGAKHEADIINVMAKKLGHPLLVLGTSSRTRKGQKSLEAAHRAFKRSVSTNSSNKDNRNNANNANISKLDQLINQISGKEQSPMRIPKLPAYDPNKLPITCKHNHLALPSQCRDCIMQAIPKADLEAWKNTIRIGYLNQGIDITKDPRPKEVIEQDKATDKKANIAIQVAEQKGLTGIKMVKYAMQLIKEDSPLLYSDTPHTNNHRSLF